MKEERQDRFEEIINLIIKMICLLLAFALGTCLAFFVANRYGEGRDNEKMRAQIESQATQIKVLEENLARLESQAVSAQEENEELRTKMEEFEKVTVQIYGEARANLESNLRSYRSNPEESVRGNILLCEEDEIYSALLEVMQKDLQGKDYTSESTNQSIQEYCDLFRELCPDSDKQEVFSHMSQLSSHVISYQSQLEQLRQESEKSNWTDIVLDNFYILERYERRNSFWDFFSSFAASKKYEGKYMYLIANVDYENGKAKQGDEYAILVTDEEITSMGFCSLYVYETEDTMMADTSSYNHGEEETELTVYEQVEYEEQAVQNEEAVKRCQTVIHCAEEMLEKCLTDDKSYVESVADKENYLEMIGIWSGTDEQTQNQYQLEVTNVFDDEITFDIIVTSADGTQKDEICDNRVVFEGEILPFAFEESEVGHAGTGTIEYTLGSAQATLAVTVSHLADNAVISPAVQAVVLTQN